MARKKNEEMTPTEYFNILKDKRKTTSDEDLTNFYNGALQTVDKIKITGQKRLIQKLRFLVDCVEKEREIVKLGINTFVYRDDIEEYIDSISKNPVKIIELENYPRDIPDEIVSIIEKTKPYFDKMYVLFTDYTGEVEKTVEKRRREKDPILFGTFQKKVNGTGGFVLNSEYLLNDRFYYLGDWEDEYCDLTMDKFLREAGKQKLKDFGIPKNQDEIKKELDRLDDELKIVDGDKTSQIYKKKKGFLSRIFKK